MRYTIQILKLLFVTCVWKVEGNAFLKRRLSTLEMRVNVIDNHIEALNTSLVTLEDQMCPNEKNEHGKDIKQSSDQSDGVSQSTETLIKKGLVGEKQWVRKEMRIIKNDIRKVENQIESNIYSEMVKEIDARIHVMVNDFDRKLHVMERTISEVIANYSAEIRKRDEKMNEQQRVIDNLKEIVNSTKMDNLKQTVNNTETDNLKQTEDEVKEEFSSCPEGWATFQSFCYLYVKEKKTYFSARETCLKLGASVADVQSSSENDFVYKFCENNGHTWTSTSWLDGNVWLGITDDDTEGVWISDRTRGKSTYTNWRSGQPDGGTYQNCLFMGYETPLDQWNDLGCNSSVTLTDRFNAHFVCKRKL